MPGTGKLGRDIVHRAAVLRGMVTLPPEDGKIEITVTCAKEVRSLMEKLATLIQENNLYNQRMTLSFTTKEDVTHKLFSEIAPKYTGRKGGCTRIMEIGPRRGDAAEVAIIGLT